MFGSRFASYTSCTMTMFHFTPNLVSPFRRRSFHFSKILYAVLGPFSTKHDHPTWSIGGLFLVKIHRKQLAKTIEWNTVRLSSSSVFAVAYFVFRINLNNDAIVIEYFICVSVLIRFYESISEKIINNYFFLWINLLIFVR